MFARVMASKVMIRLSEKLKFLPVSQFLSDGFIKDNDDKIFPCILEVSFNALSKRLSWLKEETTLSNMR